MDKSMVLIPRLSEKTYGLSVTGNVYAFAVPGDATKHTVARAVSAQFDVTVVSVNIVNVAGKVKRSARKGQRPALGKRSDLKKAYVMLKAGDKLPFFETEEDKDTKKASKKASAKKETK